MSHESNQSVVPPSTREKVERKVAALEAEDATKFVQTEFGRRRVRPLPVKLLHGMLVVLTLPVLAIRLLGKTLRGGNKQV